jgi:hypothetical protein
VLHGVVSSPLVDPRRPLSSFVVPVPGQRSASGASSLARTSSPRPRLAVTAVALVAEVVVSCVAAQLLRQFQLVAAPVCIAVPGRPCVAYGRPCVAHGTWVTCLISDDERGTLAVVQVMCLVSDDGRVLSAVEQVMWQLMSLTADGLTTCHLQ